jgi:hypothetical protein
MNLGSDLNRCLPAVHRRRSPASLAPSLMAVASIALAGLTGCAETILGNLTSTGGDIGDWNVTANYCSSSVVGRPLGSTSLVWAAHRTGTFSLLRLNTGAVSGRIILVSMETTDPPREIHLHPEDCAHMDIRQPRQPDGSVGLDVELDCRTGDGGRITASVHAESCR